VKNRWTILYLEQKLATCLLAKVVLLSEIMVWGSDTQCSTKETYNLLTSDFGEWHRFDPFGEVVSGYHQESQLRLCSGEWTNHVQPPLHEGPRTRKVWRSVLGLFDAEVNL